MSASPVNSYLKKHRFLEAQLKEPIHPETHIIIVIPCFNETGLINGLEALWNCDRPSCTVEIITVINAGTDADESIKETNRKTLMKAQEWATHHRDERFKFLFMLMNDLPQRHAGVGLARKIGMDEAVARLESISNATGIIVCFDADASCDKNYLTAIENHFKILPHARACSIYFEHPLEGETYEPAVYEGIARYELFLRYYHQALRYSGFPYSFHTIGSSMAVRSVIYQQQGGMNRRQAGEDFYFLHKLIPLGNFSVVNSTRVIPSPRPSDRVPFGTGRAIQSWLADATKSYMAYHPTIFYELKQWIETLNEWHCRDDYDVLLLKLPIAIRSFLRAQEIATIITEIKENTSSWTTFEKRLFRWFDGFKALKYVHYAREHFYPSLPIEEVATELLVKTGKEPNMLLPSVKELLLVYRGWDMITN